VAAFHRVVTVVRKGGGLAQARPRRKRGGVRSTELHGREATGAAWVRRSPTGVMRGGRGGHGDGEVGSST
jgi:hypothetical protein